MPFSQSSQISSIIRFIENLAPKSILDVGVGMGQYGFLARTNLELVNLFNIDGAYADQKDRSLWSVTIDGIEGCKIYQTPVHQYAYNQIIWEEALLALSKIADNQYEFVMAVDILEHFEKQDGFIFLQELKRVARRSVLISTPKAFAAQEVAANPLENHRSFWSSEELDKFGYTEEIMNSESLIRCAALN